MPEDASLAAIRAAVDVIAPGDADTPGGLEARADRHVIELIEQTMPGSSDLVAALLDAYARESDGADFAALDDEARGRVLQRMWEDESVDVRDAADALLLFTYGAVYSEWSGYDPGARTLAPPRSWSAVGFPGPAYAHPEYRDDLPDNPPPTSIRPT